jgi:hypothetical protein
MPLTDYTFFVGELNIPNIDKPEVLEELNRFIVKYEDELLTALLGYEMYKLFKAGLTADPIEQLWVDLLTGAEFTYSNRLSKWKGFLEGGSITASSLNGYIVKPDALIKFGTTTGFASSVNTVTVDGTDGKPDWRTWDIKVEKIGFGTQKRGIEYTWDRVTGIWTLLNDASFEPNEYFVVSFIPNEDATLVVNSEKKSLIANYVYYWFMRNLMSSTTGTGETESKTENSNRVNPANKMRKAWNEMVDSVQILRSFVQVNSAVYNTFDNSIHTGNYSLYRYITTF